MWHRLRDKFADDTRLEKSILKYLVVDLHAAGGQSGSEKIATVRAKVPPDEVPLKEYCTYAT